MCSKRTETYTAVFILSLVHIQCNVGENNQGAPDYPSLCAFLRDRDQTLTGKDEEKTPLQKMLGMYLEQFEQEKSSHCEEAAAASESGAVANHQLIGLWIVFSDNMKT